MTFDDLEPRPGRDATLRALLREDLDPLAVEELQARVEALEGEIQRARRAMEAKAAKKSAADALFTFARTDGE